MSVSRYLSAADISLVILCCSCLSAQVQVAAALTAGDAVVEERVLQAVDDDSYLLLISFSPTPDADSSKDTVNFTPVEAKAEFLSKLAS